MVGKMDEDRFQPDPLIERWIRSTRRDRSMFDKYRQTDPDLNSLWKDFVKYDKPEPTFDHADMAKAFTFLNRMWYDHCKNTSVWSHDQAVDSWDPQSSPGYPDNLIYADSKQFLERHEHELEPSFTRFLEGEPIHPFWNVASKHEIRSAEKIGERKIRTFTASPKRFTYLVQRLCGDFNQKFYNSNGVTWSRVGMSPFRRGWNDFIHQLSRFINGMEFDATQYDSSVFEHLLRLVCEFRIRCFSPDMDTPENVSAMHRLYDEIIQGMCVLPGGFVFMKHMGNPSGSPNTVVDNTLCLFLVFVYSCIRAARDAGREFTYDELVTNVVAAMYGDDNTVTVSDEYAQFITPEAILRESSGLGITLRNEYPELRPVHRLKFLNCSSTFVNGCWVPVSNTDKMRGSMLHKCTTPLVTYVRLCGMRLVCYYSPVIGDIEDALKFVEANCALQFAVGYKDKTGMTAACARASYVPKEAVEALYFGYESSYSIPDELFDQLDSFYH